MTVSERTIELRDETLARLWLRLGLWSVPRTVLRTELALKVALRLAELSEPLIPLGMVSDLCRLSELSPSPAEIPSRKAFLSPAVLQIYEDRFQYRLSGDPSLQRAFDAIRRERPDDRAKSLAFLVSALRKELGLPGVAVAPGIVRTVLAEALRGDRLRNSPLLDEHSVSSMLERQYLEAAQASRRAPRLLHPVDLEILEAGLASSSESHHLAFRQLAEQASVWEREWPVLPGTFQQSGSRRTRQFDEEQFPAGGYTSLSNRGSLESLLHSQLALMEKSERPDLFDVKFLRDELLYFSRDDNQFHRPRTTIVFLLRRSLARLHFSDPESPLQRIVRLLAFLVVFIRLAAHALTTHSLQFHIVMADEPGQSPLEWEMDLLRLALRTAVENGLVSIETATESQLSRLHEKWSERQQVVLLELRAVDENAFGDSSRATLTYDGPVPRLKDILVPASLENRRNALEDDWRLLFVAVWAALLH